MCTSTYGHWAIFNCKCTRFLRKYVKTTCTLHVWACDLFPNFKYTHCTWEMSWWAVSFNRDSVSKLWIHTSSQEVYVSRRTARPSSFSLFQIKSIYSAQDSRYNLLTNFESANAVCQKRLQGTSVASKSNSTHFPNPWIHASSQGAFEIYILCSYAHWPHSIVNVHFLGTGDFASTRPRHRVQKARPWGTKIELIPCTKIAQSCQNSSSNTGSHWYPSRACLSREQEQARRVSQIDPFAIFSRVKSCSWGWSQSLLTECTLSQEVLDIYVHSVHTSMWLICQTSSTHIFTRGMSRWDDSSFHCDLFHTISTRLITGTIWHLRNLCALEYSAYFQVTSTNTAQSLRFESLPSLNL